jgi:hypothetical protein
MGEIAFISPSADLNYYNSPKGTGCEIGSNLSLIGTRRKNKSKAQE